MFLSITPHLRKSSCTLANFYSNKFPKVCLQIPTTPLSRQFVSTTVRHRPIFLNQNVGLSISSMNDISSMNGVYVSESWIVFILLLIFIINGSALLKREASQCWGWCFREQLCVPFRDKPPPFQTTSTALHTHSEFTCMRHFIPPSMGTSRKLYCINRLSQSDLPSLLNLKWVAIHYWTIL